MIALFCYFGNEQVEMNAVQRGLDQNKQSIPQEEKQSQLRRTSEEKGQYRWFRLGTSRQGNEEGEGQYT